MAKPGFVVLLALTPVIAAVACGGAPSSQGSSEASGSGGAGAGGASGGASGGTSTSMDSTGTGGTECIGNGGITAQPTCRETCMSDADCCPNPPGNCRRRCDELGVCRAPDCCSDADCSENYRCVPINGGIGACVQPCSAENPDCPGESECTGVDDEGGSYCRVEVETCDQLGCGQLGECRNSVCTCDGPDDCGLDGYICTR